MLARAILRAADRAHSALHRAPDGNFLFDAAVNLANQPVRLRAAQHIRPALEIRRAVLRQHLRVKNPRHLLFRRPYVVHHAGLSDEKRRQFTDAALRKPLVVPVHLIVAQPHGKHIDLLRRDRFLRQPVDFFQLLRTRRAAQLHARRLCNFHVVSSCSAVSFSACAR